MNGKSAMLFPTPIILSVILLKEDFLLLIFSLSFVFSSTSYKESHSPIVASFTYEDKRSKNLINIIETIK